MTTHTAAIRHSFAGARWNSGDSYDCYDWSRGDVFRSNEHLSGFMKSEVVAIPFETLRRYASLVVLERGRARRHSRREWFAAADGFEGAWGCGDTEGAALRDLEQAVFELAVQKLEEEGGLPAVGDLEPTALR